jgi:hypothetical protein
MPSPIIYVPSRVGEGYFTDFQAPAALAADNGKVWAWNSATGKFEPIALVVYEAAGAVAAHVAAADPHTGYLLATGTRTGATTQAQTFTNGIVGPSWKPAADSTTAVRIFKTDGTTGVVIVDTTNARVGINSPTVPTTTLHIYAGGTNAAQGLSIDQGGANSGRLFFPVNGGAGYSIYYNSSLPGLQFSSAATPGSSSGTARMVLSDTGNLGINSNVPTSRLHVVDTATTTDAATRVSSQLTGNITLTTAGTSQLIRGGVFQVSLTQNDAVNKLSGVQGFLAISEIISGTGNARDVTGFSSIARLNGGGGVIDNAYSVLALGAMKPSGAGSVTNGYGVYIEDVSGPTNAFGIYQVGTNDLNFLGGQTGLGVTPATALADTGASTTVRAGLRIRHGAAPTSPNDGDMWTTTAGLFVRINGVTKTVTLT